MSKYLLILLMLSYFIMPVSAADMVVIHSTTVHLPKGQLLESQKPINLSQDDELTVIFSTGGVQTLRGPYQGKASDPFKHTHKADPNLITALADSVNQTHWQPLVLRGQHTQPDDIWLIDISTKKRFYCVAPSSQVTLWRPKDPSAARLSIKHKTTGRHTQNMWPAQKTTFPWPNNLPIVYGDTYTLELEARQRSVLFKKLVLYQLPDSLPTDSHKVVWMVGKGCIPQANMLLASLR